MSDTAIPASAPYPPALRAWGLVAVFFFTAIVSVIDRGIITLVVDPIRHDLNVSDIQISLLQGLSFGIFYAVVGLPLGLTADRLSRRKLLIAGITVWSLATIMGGFAANYGHLFASRLLVGLGEATLSPCAVSMIGDMFAPRRRGMAIGVYLMGQGIASGLAIWITGIILDAVPRGAFAAIPILSGLAPWRATFVLCGLMGFVAVALLLLCKEPVRRGVLVKRGAGLGIAPVVGYMRRHWPVFGPFYLGSAILSISTFGIVAWKASVLIRTFHLTPAAVGGLLGPASIIAGVAGSLAGGQLIDFATRRGIRGGKFLILMGLCFGALPAALAVLAPTVGLAVLLLTFAVFTTPMIGIALNAAAQEMVPSNMRGVAVSLFGFTNTILGMTLGPLLIAAVSEHLFKDPGQVGYSMIVVVLPAQLAACLIFALGYRALRQSLAARGELQTIMNSEAAPRSHGELKAQSS